MLLFEVSFPMLLYCLESAPQLQTPAVFFFLFFFFPAEAAAVERKLGSWPAFFAMLTSHVANRVVALVACPQIAPGARALPTFATSLRPFFSPSTHAAHLRCSIANMLLPDFLQDSYKQYKDDTTRY
jgi:hypothetical protein